MVIRVGIKPNTTQLRRIQNLITSHFTGKGLDIIYSMSPSFTTLFNFHRRSNINSVPHHNPQAYDIYSHIISLYLDLIIVLLVS